MARKPPPKSDMPPSRRMRGFEPASGLLSRRIQKAGESRGFAITRLLTHWPEVVGEELAGLTRPIKVGYTREGMGASLTVLVSAVHAPMVEMQKERLRTRVNAVYGYNAISRILLTQTAPTGFAEGQASFAHGAGSKAQTELPQPSPEANAVADGVEDEGLRRALAMLAQNVLAKNRT